MQEDVRKRLGKKAKELRKRMKKTQQDVADALNYPRTDISGFESRGERITTLERIEKLFTYFGYELGPVEKKTTPIFES